VEKFRNFNGCKLVGVTHSNNPPKSMLVKHLMRAVGYGPYIFQEVRKNLNYSYGFAFYDEKEKKVKSVPYVSVLIDSIRRKFSRKLPGRTTFAFTEDDVIIIVSQFQPYTPLEKVFMPFEPEVWYGLIATFIFISSVIVVTRFLSKKWFKFVFGSRVQSPMTNMM
jgi:hypothetical protein